MIMQLLPLRNTPFFVLKFSPLLKFFLITYFLTYLISTTMKSFETFRFSTGLLLFTALTMSFMACQKDDLVLPNATSTASIELRTSPPSVPAILEVPEGYEVSFHTYATGVQVYKCMETSPGVFAWVFKEPIAGLYANENYNGETGIHYAGPTWESNSGSKVVGFRLQGATVDPDAIPWLLLGVVSSQGPGPLAGTSFIQRVNTAGGKAPTTGANASTLGQEVSIDYTAEYFFYKPE